MSRINEAVTNILLLGYELPAVECKDAFNLASDKWMLGKTLRAMMGMANLEGGGIIVIGVKESRPGLALSTFPQDYLDSWGQEDLRNKSAEYFDPPIDFVVSKVEVNGSWVVGIQVTEFGKVPVIAKKDFQAPNAQSGKTEMIFRNGACYIRSQAKLSTEEVPSATEMRTLLDHAINKGIRREIARLRDLGLLPNAATVASPSSQEQYDRELEDIE